MSATTVAVVQSGPVPFDSPATARKVAGLIAEAGGRGARLAVFPEAMIGTYPKGLTFGAPLGKRTEQGRDEYAQYAAAAVTLDGEEIATVAEAAAAHDVFVVVGVIERDGGTLYCTSVHISPGSGVVGHHRKLMPTGAELLVWGFGDDYASALEANDAGYLIRGGSVIVGPSGDVLAGPVYDREEILTAEIDVADRSRFTFDFDPAGHYARPDVFSLTVDERPKPSVRFDG